MDFFDRFNTQKQIDWKRWNEYLFPVKISEVEMCFDGKSLPEGSRDRKSLIDNCQVDKGTIVEECFFKHSDLIVRLLTGKNTVHYDMASLLHTIESVNSEIQEWISIRWPMLEVLEFGLKIRVEDDDSQWD